MSDLRKQLVNLSSCRQQQAELYQKINEFRASYDPRLDSVSSGSSLKTPGLSAQQQELMEFYKAGFMSAAEELKILSELIHKTRSQIMKRRGRGQSTQQSNNNSNTATNNNSSSSAHHQLSSISGSGLDPSSSSTPSAQNYASLISELRLSILHNTPPPSLYEPESGSYIQLKRSTYKNTKLDIWSHEGIRLLPVNLACAAWTNDNWMLATVNDSRHFGTRTRYQIKDADSSLEAEKFYLLDAKRVVPLPSLCEIGANKRYEFTAGEVVMAVFPENNITVLYPAIVIYNRKKKDLFYTVRFDDDDRLREVMIDRVFPQDLAGAAD